MEELMTQQRREQLPIEAILRNSQYAAGEDLAGDSYFLPGLAPAPASANMSEYELELILRQLKEYAGLYEDMMHNFQAINRRLREEDMRKSGNFNLRKPHVSGAYCLAIYHHCKAHCTLILPLLLCVVKALCL
jgi:hypothetical protein